MEVQFRIVLHRQWCVGRPAEIGIREYELIACLFWTMWSNVCLTAYFFHICLLEFASYGHVLQCAVDISYGNAVTISATANEMLQIEFDTILISIIRKQFGLEFGTNSRFTHTADNLKILRLRQNSSGPRARTKLVMVWNTIATNQILLLQWKMFNFHKWFSSFLMFFFATRRNI